MKVISNMPVGKKTKGGIALPDTKEHRIVINKIIPAANNVYN
ncbi:hypothetical protein [Psychroserpens ponticola]|uniref:Uncharacterized protein n=1 Tax=Psychroserpens ponticola TaxID=2932268 RepID=A0ABY7RU01_9FLAO|nr:hypothetical protein [Psychroserpens ponticola]WCO00579.1 hypothetical protein MUN68_010930 [Psychroserpens ponticola]